MEQKIKLLGFAPDLDPRTPGIILDGTRFIPTLDGFRPMREPVTVGLPALASDCRGAIVAKKTDDSQRFFAGTQTKLYESSSGTSWVDVSNGTYTGGSETRWRFAQFGNTSYAVNKADNMQFSLSGNFADRSGAPKASIIEAVWPGFLMVFDYDDGVNDYADGWYCCALNDDTDWVNSIATQSASGRLKDTPGPIRAGKRLGQNIIAYKERSMYIGTYVGPPPSGFIFDWQLIPGDIGAPSQESVVNIETAHIFPGYENFYYFDGSRPVAIGNPLKEYFNATIDKTRKYKMQTLHDRDNSCAYFFYADSNGTIVAGLVYNYRADKWGKASFATGKSLEAVVEYLSGGISYDSMGTLYQTWDNLPMIPYDSPFWTASTPQPAIFLNDHIIYSLTGTPTNTSDAESVITCGFTGQDDIYSCTNRIRTGFISDNTDSVNVGLRVTDYIGGTITTKGPYSLNGNKADMQHSAKWHSPEFTLRGDYEIGAYTREFIAEGME